MLKSDRQGRARTGFRYFDKGDMATIGRKAAVAKIEWPFKAHWSGFPAWVMWLVVHVFFLIGYRNRLSVLRQWAWTYITFNDGVRLITARRSCRAGRTQTAAIPDRRSSSRWAKRSRGSRKGVQERRKGRRFREADDGPSFARL